MNAGFDYREQIGRTAAGQTVLAHLSRRYRHSSEAVWRERVALGQVWLRTAPAAGTEVLRPGDALVWRRPPWEEPEVPLAYAILYRDADLLAVAKPRGLPSVPNGGFLTHTLLHRVGRTFPEATPLHRLGRGTSGVLLFARTATARRGLAAAWRRGEVEKTYRALVSGIPERSVFSIDVPIGRVPHPRLGTVHAACPDGKAALTHVRVIEGRCTGAVVEATIPTGRPHQIRIHLAAAGHALVGDPLYGPGGRPQADPGLPGDLGYALHAQRLRFLHPVSGRSVEVECAPPMELRTAE